MENTLDPNDLGQRTLSARVVEALIEHDLVERAQRPRAEEVVDAALLAVGPEGFRPEAVRPASPAAPPLSRKLSEVAGYVGGALVVGAGALFLANEWGTMAYGIRLAFLVVTTVVLATASAALVVSGGGPRTVRTSTEAVRRRLVSTLASGTAACAAFTIGMQVDHAAGSADSAPLLAAGAALVVIGLVGYLVAPTVLGQLVLGAGVWMMAFSALDLAGVEGALTYAVVLLVIGIVWVILAETCVWRERVAAGVIGCAAALLGAQWPVFNESHGWVGYVLTALVAIAAFTVYVNERVWPYLATGVAAVTLVVPEALADWTDGGLGAAGLLLISGITLLVASLVGLRLRRELGEPER